MCLASELKAPRLSVQCSQPHGSQVPGRAPQGPAGHVTRGQGQPGFSLQWEAQPRAVACPAGFSSPACTFLPVPSPSLWQTRDRQHTRLQKVRGFSREGPSWGGGALEALPAPSWGPGLRGGSSGRGTWMPPPASPFSFPPPPRSPCLFTPAPLPAAAPSHHLPLAGSRGRSRASRAEGAQHPSPCHPRALRTEKRGHRGRELWRAAPWPTVRWGRRCVRGKPSLSPGGWEGPAHQ